LKIKVPFAADVLREFAAELIAKNQMPDSLLRLTLSRGVGIRGYSPKGADRPTVVMSLHPAPALAGAEPPTWRLITSSSRLPANEALAQFKTCNKLAQVQARAEADAAGADEALLLNTDGFVVEGASSSLFWPEGESLSTPPLLSGILAGVTRVVVLELCEKLRVAAREKNIRPEELPATDGVFVSLSSFGVVAAHSLDGRSLKQSPLVAKIQSAYSDLLRAETR
jgi:branched-subunit amino acid aminotransferase/4-amino-4-deoxychorismate lyase